MQSGVFVFYSLDTMDFSYVHACLWQRLLALLLLLDFVKIKSLVLLNSFGNTTKNITINRISCKILDISWQMLLENMVRSKFAPPLSYASNWCPQHFQFNP